MTESASFTTSLCVSEPVVTLLSATPTQWAAWMDVVSPVGFKALVLLAEPLTYSPPSTDANDWAVVALVERGMDYWEAEDGVAELATKGFLPGDPTTLAEMFARCTPPPQAPVVRQPPQPRCRVCGGTSRVPAPDATTYIVKRGRFVKIGVTTNFARRRAVLASGDTGVIVPAGFDHSSPLKVIGHTDVREHDLHELLGGHYEVGEWFRDSPAFRAALHKAASIR